MQFSAMRRCILAFQSLTLAVSFLHGRSDSNNKQPMGKHVDDVPMLVAAATLKLSDSMRALTPNASAKGSLATQPPSTLLRAAIPGAAVDTDVEQAVVRLRRSLRVTSANIAKWADSDTARISSSLDKAAVVSKQGNAEVLREQRALEAFKNSSQKRRAPFELALGNLENAEQHMEEEIHQVQHDMDMEIQAKKKQAAQLKKVKNATKMQAHLSSNASKRRITAPLKEKLASRIDAKVNKSRQSHLAPLRRQLQKRIREIKAQGAKAQGASQHHASASAPKTSKVQSRESAWDHLRRTLEHRPSPAMPKAQAGFTLEHRLRQLSNSSATQKAPATDLPAKPTPEATHAEKITARLHKAFGSHKTTKPPLLAKARPPDAHEGKAPPAPSHKGKKAAKTLAPTPDPLENLLKDYEVLKSETAPAPVVHKEAKHAKSIQEDLQGFALEPDPTGHDSWEKFAAKLHHIKPSVAPQKHENSKHTSSSIVPKDDGAPVLKSFVMSEKLHQFLEHGSK